LTSVLVDLAARAGRAVALDQPKQRRRVRRMRVDPAWAGIALWEIKQLRLPCSSHLACFMLRSGR
jgi:hypothetical protein